MKTNEDTLIQLIQSDPWKMEVLRSVRSLNLPDWLIGAGFVRNAVWDYLHEYKESSPATDIDIAYFDENNLNEGIEGEYQEKLNGILKAEWSVTNQARMASINHQPKQYISTEDAIAHWPETATCIGIRLEADDTITVIAPYGLDDLFSLIVRMSPKFGDGIEDYNKRIAKKKWIEKWSKLNFIS